MGDEPIIEQDNLVVPEVMEQQAQMDTQDDMQEFQQENFEDQQFQQSDFGGMGTARPRNDIFTFFNNILKMTNSIKVAFLDKFELGKVDLSVRGCGYISIVSDQMHNKVCHDFYRAKQELTLASSMSRKGWLVDSVISQKRITQRMTQPILSNAPPPKKGFFSSFSGGNNPPQQQQ
jgi:hypothetical protein